MGATTQPAKPKAAESDRASKPSSGGQRQPQAPGPFAFAFATQRGFLSRSAAGGPSSCSACGAAQAGEEPCPRCASGRKKADEPGQHAMAFALGGPLHRKAEPGAARSPAAASQTAPSPRPKESTPAPAGVPPSVHRALAGPSHGLDPVTRGLFEPRLGRDLGHVRLHTDSLATEAAHDVSAHAFAVGSHIAVRSDLYSPHSTEGRRLLAHEVIHTLQPSTPGIQKDSLISAPDDPAEKEADSLAGALAGPMPAGPIEPKAEAGPGIQRRIDPDAKFTLPSIEFIASIVVGTKGLRAIVHPTTKFSQGPKVHQGIALFFHAVAASSFTKDLVVSFIRALDAKHPSANPADGFVGDAKGGEAFPKDCRLSHEYALDLVGFLEANNIAHIVTADQKELLSLGESIDFFISSVKDAGIQQKLGVTLPAWYDLDTVGRRDLNNFGPQLRAYRDTYNVWKANRTPENTTALLTSMSVLLKLVAAPALVMEEIRKDAALADHPSYKLLWPPAGKPAQPPQVGDATPAAPTGALQPGTIAPETQAPDATFAHGFIGFARTQPALLDEVFDPSAGPDARKELLDLFIQWAPQAFAAVPKDEKILNAPAMANLRPHPARLTAVPAIGPPLFDAALESDYHFWMQLQFNDVFDAFAGMSFSYQWERVKVPKDQMGALADVSKLKGETPKLGEVASLRYARAGDYAYEDIVRSVGTLTGKVGPPGVSVELAGLNAAFRFLGTTFSLGIDALTTPNSEKKIAFPDGEGFYVVLCRAAQKPTGKGFLRAQSVAWLPVFVRAAGQMAEIRLAGAITNRDDAKKRLAELQKILAGPGPIPDKDALVKEAEDLYKVLESPTEARWKQVNDLQDRKKQVEERIKKLEAGEPANPGESLFKLRDELKAIEKQLSPLEKIQETRKGRSTPEHDLSKSEPLTAVFVDDKGQTLYLVLEAVAMKAEAGSFKYYVSDTTTPKSTDGTGEGKTKDEAILAAVRSILESAAGYGRGQLSIEVGSNKHNLRIAASAGAMVLEAAENISLALSIAAVAAAPFTGGASLVLMIPAGIVGAIPSAYRIIRSVADSTFHFDLEFAMDLVNILGSLVGLGEVAVPLRFVRVGQALLVIGAGVNGLGVILMGAQIIDQIMNLKDLPPGMRAARIMAILGNALMQAGIMAGQHLVAKAKVKSMESAVSASASSKMPEHLEKSFKEWESKLSEKTREQLATDPDLLKLYREMDPAVRKALTLCASPCIPTDPRPSANDIARIQKIMQDLGFPPDHQGLREYLHRNRNDVTAAVDALATAKSTAEAQKTFDSSIAGKAKGGTAAKGSDGKWKFTRAENGTVVAEHSVGTHGDLTSEGTGGFFQSHHGIQDVWAKEKGLGPHGYDRDACPAILLRDSHTGSPHQRITARQKEREGGRKDSTYSNERQNLKNDMVAADVPPATAEKLLAQSDAYFAKLYENAKATMQKEGKPTTAIDAELARIFGDWYPNKP